MADLTLFGALNKSSECFTRPAEANKNDEYMCVDCYQDVILRQGPIRRAHFAHHTNGSCGFFNEPNFEQIHKNAQCLLKNILENSIQVTVVRKCDCGERTDSFTIPEMTETACINLEHRFEHNGLKIADLAYLVMNHIQYIFEIRNTHETKEGSRPEPWFEFDAKELIERVNAYDEDDVGGNILQLNCVRHLTCAKCDNKEYVDVNPGDSSEVVVVPNGTCYINQRGAGCGKTYESIQIMQDDIRFGEKDLFIYLTKTHSAKEVIYNELREQEARGVLDKLTLFVFEDSVGKQYKITFRNKATKKEKQIIIGTLDSFTFALTDKNKIVACNNYFKGIVSTLTNGDVSTKEGRIVYAGKRILINERCLVNIDEGQDLGMEYVGAIITMINKLKIDVFIIGDKLQSIMGEHNLLTYFENNDLENVKIERSSGINKVMRFHNKQFKDFVNQIIPFEKHGLVPITEICGGSCKYTHENNITPYIIFQTTKIYGEELNYDAVDRLIERIIADMDREVMKYNYLPNNFMFIFPILTRNVFATLLESRIQQYWIHKCKDDYYQEHVLRPKGVKIGDDFVKHVYLHKSEEGKPINLKESENATRILSIHAAKGNGCEVVFVLGISEESLKRFSKEKSNLVYDSLLHVAITRQKKMIYFGIDCLNGDIAQRFKTFGIIEDKRLKPDLSHITKYHKYDKIKKFVNNDDELFTEINNTIIVANNYKQKMPKKEHLTSDIIDWGHHVLRYELFMNTFNLRLIENDVFEDKLYTKQFTAILKAISSKRIQMLPYSEYNNKLREIDKCKKKHKPSPSSIPILRFDSDETSKYYKYTIIVEKMIVRIQFKIINFISKKQKLHFCPLESLIFAFIMKVHKNGSYSDITILDIYSFVSCYDTAFEGADEKHSAMNNCVCDVCFKKDKQKNLRFSSEDMNITAIRKSLTNHYNLVSKIDDKYRNYKKCIANEFGIEDMTYNLLHDVWFEDENENFGIYNEFSLIGHSEKHVIHFIIKPQFNELNFNSIIIDSLFDQFIVSHCSAQSNNFNRYNNKKLLACIMTLDTDKPIFYEYSIDRNNIAMKQSIKKYLMSKDSAQHELIYDFYEFCKKDKPLNISSIKHTMDEFKKYTKLPGYITYFFYDLDKELNACKGNRFKIENVLLNVMDRETFVNSLNAYLETEIDAFLKMVEDNTIVEY